MPRERVSGRRDRLLGRRQDGRGAAIRRRERDPRLQRRVRARDRAHRRGGGHRGPDRPHRSAGQSGHRRAVASLHLDRPEAEQVRSRHRPGPRDLREIGQALPRSPLRGPGSHRQPDPRDRTARPNGPGAGSARRRAARGRFSDRDGRRRRRHRRRAGSADPRVLRGGRSAGTRRFLRDAFSSSRAARSSGRRAPS